jgi:hypothetical protein
MCDRQKPLFRTLERKHTPKVRRGAHIVHNLPQFARTSSFFLPRKSLSCPRKLARADFRLGSDSDIWPRYSHVCSSPNSGLCPCQFGMRRDGGDHRHHPDHTRRDSPRRRRRKPAHASDRAGRCPRCGATHAPARGLAADKKTKKIKMGLRKISIHKNMGRRLATSESVVIHKAGGRSWSAAIPASSRQKSFRKKFPKKNGGSHPREHLLTC